MLRNIPTLLSPELLLALAEMGHGDDIVIVDANFPAHSTGPKVVRLDSARATDVLTAVLTLLPLDHFDPEPAITMQVVDDANAVPEIIEEFQTIINEHADRRANTTSIDRFAFYERAKNAYVVVQTGERRLYGNILLKKGVIEQ